jgi:hypothetical protein
MTMHEIRKKIIAKACWTLFPLLERFGVHVLPIHYYSPIPDTRWLRTHRDLFDVEYPMDGVDLNDAGQMRLVKEVVARYEQEFRTRGGKGFGFDSGQLLSFAPINALVLYSFIRHYRPRRIIEIGSGRSTIIAAEAVRSNTCDGHPCQYMVIEPFPGEQLRRGMPGVDALLEQKAEDVPLEVFSALKDNDILFIDSSHTVKVLGDVNHLYLRVLPRIGKGVIVHIHDIFFPLDYRPHHFEAKAKQIWQEQYLLHAFLVYNSEFEVLLSNSYLHHKHRRELVELFPWYDQNRLPSSFWMRRRP